MSNKKVDISIIVVNYRSYEKLLNCLASVKNSHPKISYEVIVVDNDEKKTIEKDLKLKFNWVSYIKSLGNIGFGAGNNLGAEYAKGEYLFFLNPDTIVLPESIDHLYKFIVEDKKVGVVAPLLLDTNNKPYPLQGTADLTPIRAIFALSFINKLFLKNPISRKFWLLDWNRKQAKECYVVPGTSFLISRNIFKKIGGFDEKFFLYFEEFDLCKRIKNLGLKNYIIPNARVIHIWGASTRKRKGVNDIFVKSRLYYFKKWYGIIPALIVHLVTSIGKSHMLLSVILIFSVFLRIYNLDKLMVFIGDQGWFYLSARDALLTGKIPLVGITASHTWLHQGPFWTYILIFTFWIFNFNPISPAYFTAILGTLSVWLVYKVAGEFFSKRIGIIAAALYAASPLVIINSRMPYHTAPIPFFTLLFMYSVYKWVKGNVNFFPLTLFFLGVLYNFELATTILWAVLIAILIYGLKMKRDWATKVINKKIISMSVLLLLLPMLPVIIYDLTHGFLQTAVFAFWIFYQGIKFISSLLSNSGQVGVFANMFLFFSTFYTRLIFIGNGIIAAIIFVISIGYFLTDFYRKLRIKKISFPYVFILLMLAVPFIGFLINKTPSEAYLPILFPPVIIVTSLVFDKALNYNRVLSLGALLLIVFLNSYFLLSENFFANPTFSQRADAVNKIIKLTSAKQYNLLGKGIGSKFESFTMNYEFLLWLKKHPPIQTPSQFKVFVEETPKGITISER